MQKIADKNPVYATLATLLCERIRQMNRGDVITHDAISKMIGFEKDSPAWRTVMKRTRKLLLEGEDGTLSDGLTLHPVPGVGFQLPLRDMQLDRSIRYRQKKRMRQTRYELKELEHTSPMGLSVQSQLARSAAMDRTKKQAELIRHDMQALKSMLAPDPANKTPIPPSRNGQKPAAVGQ